jgi:Zn-dependent membrane protease YugP
MCPHTYYYICVLRATAFFCLIIAPSFFNISDRACASVTLVGIVRYTDVCVRVCVCVCVCVCTYVLTFCVCLPGCFVASVIYLFLRGTKYISVLVLLYF